MRFSGRSIRGSLITIAVLVTGAGVGFCAHPGLPGGMQLHERKHDAKRQVEALEEQWRTAQLAGDVDAMDKMLSDDYIGISMTGQVTTKVQQLDRARNHKFMITRLDLGEMQVKMVGAIAIVTSRAQVEGTSDGAPVKGTFRYTRVYQRLPSGVWKITSFEATRVPEARDGLHGNQGKPDKAPPGSAPSSPPPTSSSPP